jgi:hypothetical protein
MSNVELLQQPPNDTTRRGLGSSGPKLVDYDTREAGNGVEIFGDGTVCKLWSTPTQMITALVIGLAGVLAHHLCK